MFPLLSHNFWTFVNDVVIRIWWEATLEPLQQMTLRNWVEPRKLQNERALFLAEYGTT
jgi:hypothetical protein